MPVKIYSPENFILDFIKNFWSNTDKIVEKWKKNLIKLKNWKYFEIKETKFDPHWPDWDWDEFTEKNRKAYKEAMKNFEKWNKEWSNSLEELKTKLWV